MKLYVLLDDEGERVFSIDNATKTDFIMYPLSDDRNVMVLDDYTIGYNGIYYIVRNISEYDDNRTFKPVRVYLFEMPDYVENEDLILTTIYTFVDEEDSPRYDISIKSDVVDLPGHPFEQEHDEVATEAEFRKVSNFWIEIMARMLDVEEEADTGAAASSSESTKLKNNNLINWKSSS